MSLSDKSITSATAGPEKKKELLSAQKQLYRAAHLASVGTLASGVAHEINNQLTAILGFSSALLARVNNHEEIDRNELGSYLQIIHNESLRCRDIVESFRRFAREGGDVRIGRYSLLESIVNARRLVNVRAVRSEVSIVNDVREDILVQTDAGKLGQVFVNLLIGCIDFCGPGTTITISAAAGKKTSEASGTSEYAEVIVRDNGPGMTAEALAEVYSLFFTARETGVMGLAFCRRGMEELGGRIDCASEAGRGTTVRLEIPCDPGRPSGRTHEE